LNTSLGKIECKRIKSPEGDFRLAPEYESCKKIAIEKRLPIKTVYDKVLLHLHSGSPHKDGA